MTYSQKSKIIEHAGILKAKTKKEVNYETLANWAQKEFHLPHTPSKATISRIFRDKHKFNALSHQDASIKRTRVVTNEVIEESLALWVLQMQHRKVSISCLMIQEKKREFARRLNLGGNVLQFSDN